MVQLATQRWFSQELEKMRHQATTSTQTSLSQVLLENTFNVQNSLENVALGLKFPVLAWNCTMSCQEHPPWSSSLNKPNFIPVGATPSPAPTKLRSCRGFSEDRLFPSPAVWVRARGNIYFMSLLQLRFLRSFKEITQRNHQQALFHGRREGISRGCS